jgi:uncharacterized DUF497 family protein
MDRDFGSFVWDLRKEATNLKKHGVDFRTAAKAFKDTRRKIYTDERHAAGEERLFCIGKVSGRVLTVRFIYREGKFRSYGAGYWRKGRHYYEQEEG